jgi:hypothetical protein
MAFGILQTFWNRLQKIKGIGPGSPEHYIMRQIEMTDGKHDTIEHEIIEKERRPMIEVPAYIEKFKK